jgi:hypothetical protein
MGQHMAYITLDSVITDYLGESEQSIHRYKKVFDIIFRGMDHMGIDFFYQVQTVKLPVNANLTVTLPANCLNVVKAGVLNSNGEIVTLYINNKLTTYADLLPNRLSKTQDNTIFNWDITCNGGWYYNYWANGTYTSLYGLPSGEPFVGSYKYDSINGLLLLNETFQFSYLVVECLVSPQEDQEYYVPLCFREALIAWCWWKDKKAINVKRGAVGINRDLKEEYSTAKRNAIKQYSPFIIGQAYQATQEQTRMAIK